MTKTIIGFSSQNAVDKEHIASESEQIQEKMYENRLRRIEILGGKSEYELRKKANTKIIHCDFHWRFGKQEVCE